MSLKIDPVERKKRKSDYHRLYRERNRETLLAKKRAAYHALLGKNPNYEKERYLRRREHCLAYMKQYIADGRQRQRQTGHSPQYFLEQLSKQRGLCAICGVELHKKNTHADHDHSTRNPRGVLCRSCNIGLGHFNDNQEMLTHAVEYLRMWKCAL